MILTGTEIVCQRDAGRISIEPFDYAQLNANSYDLCLAKTLRVYVSSDNASWNNSTDVLKFSPITLDCRKNNPTHKFEIPEKGFTIFPNKLYLGATVEYTATDYYVPMLEGRSSLARLGLSIHQTGGFGDVGFAGNWTLEITCVEPITIYPGIKICQVQFWTTQGKRTLYGRLQHKDSKYYEQIGPTPSRFFMETRNKK